MWKFRQKTRGFLRMAIVTMLSCIMVFEDLAVPAFAQMIGSIGDSFESTNEPIVLVDDKGQAKNADKGSSNGKVDERISVDTGIAEGEEEADAIVLGSDADSTDEEESRGLEDAALGVQAASEAYDYKVVLTWGDTPLDLDSHLEGRLPNGNSMHLWYRQTNIFYGNEDFCTLDIDETSGHGTETVLLTGVSQHPIYYYVHNYSHDAPIAGSGAKVKVYHKDNHIATFTAPQEGSSLYWNVFAIVDGAFVDAKPLVGEAGLISSSPNLAYAAGLNNVESDGYVLFTGAGRPVVGTWRDDWFGCSSMSYNHELATTSAILASAAYKKESALLSLDSLGFEPDSFSTYCPEDNDYRLDGAGANGFISDLFLNTDLDQVGHTFGTKALPDGSVLVAVLVRGTLGKEWISNFNVADTTYPNMLDEAFEEAELRLRLSLEDYLGKRSIDASRAKFLIVGHSRGGAVANILGRTVDTGYLRNPKTDAHAIFGNTFVYTFASPNVSTEQELLGGMPPLRSYRNIFNIVNPEDTVPRVPLNKWGYGKYGTVMMLPTRSNCDYREYRERLERMRPYFSAIFTDESVGTSYSPYQDGSHASEFFAKAFEKVAPSVEDFYKEEKFFARGKEYLYSTRSLVNILAHDLAEDPLDSDYRDALIGRAAKIRGALVAALMAAFYVEVPGDAINLSGIKAKFWHGHTSETYIAWLQSGDASMFAGSRRSVRIGCPVDVKVYDERDNSLVCSIVKNTVDEEVMEHGIAASVSDDVKYLSFPENARYRVELSATESGEMDITYEVLDSSEKSVSGVTYESLPLVRGETYTALVHADANGDVASEEVSLKNSVGRQVMPSLRRNADDTTIFDILASVDEGKGHVSGFGSVFPGEIVVLNAAAEDGFRFAGWFENGKLASADARYQFCARMNRNLKARFVPMGDGWFTFSDGAKGYSKGGKFVTSWLNLGAMKYYFDALGRMLVGWNDVTQDGKTMRYYFNPSSGNLARETWMEIDRSKYYFRPSGNVAHGWATISDSGVDKKYFFDDDYQLVTGWRDIEVNGKCMRYYFRPSGAMATGWATIDGEKYFFRESGNMATGFTTVTDGTKRYFDKQGHMLVGWQNIDGKRYYFRPSGAMQTGKVTIDGKAYIFSSNGVLAENSIASGVCGTCSWTLSASGLLTISAGVLADPGDSRVWPWSSQSLQITSVKLAGRVKGNRSLAKMFYCSSVESLDLTKLDTTGVTDMNYMFALCGSLRSVNMSGWNTSSVRNIRGLFSYCSSLSNVSVSAFDTSNVTNMFGVFNGCSSLKNIDVSHWNTSRVTDMWGMFSGCSSLKTLDLSGWETSRLTRTGTMFGWCSSLESLDLSGWDTSTLWYMDSMFAACSSLKKLKIANWDTSAVVVMESAFYRCTSLVNLDLSGWKTPETISMGSMFIGCTSLESLDISNFDTSHLTDAKVGSSSVYGTSLMYSECPKLASIKVGPNYEIKDEQMVPEPTSANGKWWSTTDSKWYSKEDMINSRSGIADTYTNNEVKKRL